MVSFLCGKQLFRWLMSISFYVGVISLTRTKNSKTVVFIFKQEKKILLYLFSC